MEGLGAIGDFNHGGNEGDTWICRPTFPLIYCGFGKGSVAHGGVERLICCCCRGLEGDLPRSNISPAASKYSRYCKH